MTASIDPQGWVLIGLAICPGCGDPLSRYLGGRDRRFHACACPALRDADPLERRIVATVTDHDWRWAGDRLRRYAVINSWRQASHAQLHRELRRFLAYVLVDPTGDAPACFWIVPTTGEPVRLRPPVVCHSRPCHGGDGHVPP